MIPELKPLELQSVVKILCPADLHLWTRLPDPPRNSQLFFLFNCFALFNLFILYVCLWGGGTLTEVCSPTLAVGSNSGHQALGLDGKHAAC